VNTGQGLAALMTHQDVDKASALPGLPAQIPEDEPIDTNRRRRCVRYKALSCSHRCARRHGLDSTTRRGEVLASAHARRKLAQQGDRRHRTRRRRRMEKVQRLSQAFAGRAHDVPFKSTDGQSSAVAPRRFPGDRDGHPCRDREPDGGTCTHSVHSHRWHIRS
jgi:hypothetical protein